jgi:MFS family permease
MLSLMLAITFLLLPVLCLFVPVYLRHRKNKKYPISEEELRSYLNNAQIEHEARVRKQWLVSFSTLIMISIVSSMALWLVPSPVLTEPTPDAIEQPAIACVLSIGCILACSLIGYYCAYKKRGTVWLLLSIISIPTGIVSPFLARTEPLPSGLAEWMAFSMIAGIEMWLWANCIRLRKVNGVRKTQVKLARKNKYFQQNLSCSRWEFSRKKAAPTEA